MDEQCSRLELFLELLLAHKNANPESSINNLCIYPVHQAFYSLNYKVNDELSRTFFRLNLIDLDDSKRDCHCVRDE